MNIAEFSVSKPVAVTMRIAALVVLGAISLTRLAVDLLPNVSLPIITVSTSWPNVAPEEIEAQVTRPIEESLSSVPGLYAITSTTDEGISNVRVQFQWGTDIGRAAVDVLQLIERAQRNFPVDPTLQTPLVFKFDPTQTPILIYGVSGIDDQVKLRTLMDNQVSPLIESASGVASATVTGGQQRAIIIDVDPAKLQAHGFSLADVIRRLMQENINLPAGIAKQSETEYTVRSLGWFLNPQEIANMPLGTYNGAVVVLSDVADVRDAHTETRVYTRLNGQPAVGLMVIKQSGVNTVATAQAVRDRLKLVQSLYPFLRFGLAYDQATYIQQSINDVKTSAVIGGLLAAIILLFFLRNVRSTLVVTLSIPISIISTFALVYLAGFSLNTMSLGGLALATGLIVDDAVVVLENIFRHVERDKMNAHDAAISGTMEIISAVVASTWTVMVVFLPLFFIKGQAGQMFTQFALVVIFALAISLLDATTVVPMLAARLIPGAPEAEKGEGEGEGEERPPERDILEPPWLQRAFNRFGAWFDALDHSYRQALQWAIRHRWWTLGGALALTLASLLLVPRIGTELLPVTDSGDFNVTIKLPPGTALEKTNLVMKQIEGILLANPNVATAYTSVGTGSTRGLIVTQIPFQASATVHLREDRTRSTQQVIADLRRQLSRLPGVRPILSQFDLVSLLLTGGSQNIEVDIIGSDLPTLSASANQAMARVRGIPGLENVDVNWQEAMPEIQWRVNRIEAAQLGVSFQDIANTINTATNGTIATYYQEQGFQYPVVVQLTMVSRKTVAAMLQIPVTPSVSPSPGRVVFLSQVATPVYAVGPSEITRINRQRYIAVVGTPTGRSSGAVQQDIQRALTGFRLPPGYYWTWGLDQQRTAQEFGGLGLAVILAISLIYMLLASQFESFIHPLTILMSVPLAATGVILALFLTGRAFGLTAFVGVLMLVGIVTKNGILLVSYTNTLRHRGMPRDEAVLTAAPTRLRPILMTAAAAILGMLPLAIGLGKGSEIQAPMATAVIGGLLTSTLLTLLVVPTVYIVFDDLGNRFRRRSRGRYYG